MGSQEELAELVAELTVRDLADRLGDLKIEVPPGTGEREALAGPLLERLAADAAARDQLCSFCKICCRWRWDDSVWPLTCGHLACLECLGRHIEAQIERMRASLKYRLPCIFAPDCEHEIEFRDASDMSTRLKAIWQDLRKRERLIRGAGHEVVECPKPGCVGVAYKERGKKTAMCFLCEHSWEVDPEGGDDLGGDPRYDGERVRRCPKCQVPIEKDGGCNAIACLHCGLVFDWARTRSILYYDIISYTMIYFILQYNIL